MCMTFCADFENAYFCCLCSVYVTVFYVYALQFLTLMISLTTKTRANFASETRFKSLHIDLNMQSLIEYGWTVT